MGSGGSYCLVTIQTASIKDSMIKVSEDLDYRCWWAIPQFTKLSGGNIVFVAKDTDFGSVKVKYHKQPDDVSRGDFETKAEMGANPEGDIDIQNWMLRWNLFLL